MKKARSEAALPDLPDLYQFDGFAINASPAQLAHSYNQKYRNQWRKKQAIKQLRNRS